LSVNLHHSGLPARKTNSYKLKAWKYRWVYPFLKAEERLESIRVQTEVSQALVDLKQIIEIVAKHGQSVTAARGAVVELAEGAEIVYRAAAGIAAAPFGLRFQGAGSRAGCALIKEKLFIAATRKAVHESISKACWMIGLRSMIKDESSTLKRA
jgi:hypothetical protein